MQTRRTPKPPDPQKSPGARTLEMSCAAPGSAGEGGRRGARKSGGKELRAFVCCCRCCGLWVVVVEVVAGVCVLWVVVARLLGCLA